MLIPFITVIYCMAEGRVIGTKRISIGIICLFVGNLHAQTNTVPWSGYGHDPQHTALSTIGAQRLEQIKWSTPVDTTLTNHTGSIFVHYGSPVVTAANTVILPVRTSSSNTYRVEAHSGSTGQLLYTLSTDYSPPSESWTPPYVPTLSQRTRLYYGGAGGTVYYRDQVDSATGPSGQIAFYGNALYAENQATFASNVMISTPITADASGNIYFGFRSLGSNPANLVNGLARIGVDGSGAWISAANAAGGDASITDVAANCAPAVSNDGSKVYIGVTNGSGGYLVSVDSTTLAPIGRAHLIDPETGSAARILDESTASPTIGPDNDVYYGVFESEPSLNNDDRGWLLHFDSTLTVSKTPGAFGWDDTVSTLPATLVPSYSGSSSYLLFTKYNNYYGIGPGGNGQNKIAVLDPNGPMTDPITGATVMQEVLTMLGATPNGESGVREWCINSGAIDPFAGAAMANSEDGTLYQWKFATNSLAQSVALTSGIGEAYTPTAIGADGNAYAINDGILFAVGQASNMTVASSHSGSFVQGQSGTYTLTATNNGSAATQGAVTVGEIVPSGLTATSIGGTGWSCQQPSGPCSRSDTLAAGASYQTLTLAVNIGSSAPSSVTNIAEVSSDGAANSINAIANDVTGIVPPPPALTIAKSHSGTFTQGQMGVAYTVVVSNGAAAGPTNGPVKVTEIVPPGLTLSSMSGNGWTCQGQSTFCTRSDTLSPGASYDNLTVTMNVADNAASPVTNQVNVSIGNFTSPDFSDPATVVSACALTNDGSAGIADVQKVINEAIGSGQPADDLNRDGVINTIDVQIVINAAIGMGCTL
jgi:uncharacterized repeat protein (TIGR01451 family)